MSGKIPKFQDKDVAESHKCIIVGKNRVTRTSQCGVQDVLQQEEEVETQKVKRDGGGYHRKRADTHLFMIR